MNSGKGTETLNYRKKAKTINRDVAVFAFFLLLSFGLWYVNSLGNEMETDIRYDAILVNPPKERVISSNNPVRLGLSLKGPGYSILKLKVAGHKTPVTIDLSKVNVKRVPEGKNHEYFLLTAGLAKTFTVQIRSGCEITAIKPDTVFLTLAKPGSGSSSQPR